MGIRIERLKDFTHLKEGDFVFFPAEESDKRRTRLAASSLSKLGLSVGFTGRSDNSGEYLNKIVHDMCSVPVMFRICGCYEKHVWNPQRATLLRNAATVAGPEYFKYDVTLANFALDPRLSKAKDNKDILVGAHMFEKAILDELARTLDPLLVMRNEDNVKTSYSCFCNLYDYRKNTVIDDECARYRVRDVIAENRKFFSDETRKIAYDKYVFDCNGIDFVFSSRFIAEIVKRGAVVFRATGLDGNVARRAVHEMYARCSAHHAENAKSMLGLAKRLIEEASVMAKASRGFKTLARRTVGPRKSELLDIDRMLKELGKKDK